MPSEAEATATEEPAATETPQGETRSQSSEFNAVYDREALLSNIPEGYDKESFQKYLDKTKDPYVAFKNYSNLEKMKGKGLPNAAWEESDYEALYEAMGVPKDPNGYEFGDDVQLDDDSAAFIKSFAAEAKMTPAQATKAAALLQQVRQTEEAQKAEAKEQATSNMIEFLSDQWGHPDSQSYQNNFKLVSGVLESIGIDKDSPEADAIWSGPPQVVNLLKEYADMLDPSVVSSWGAGDTTTPATLQEQLNELSMQMYKPSMDPSSKEYKDMEAKYDRIYKQLQRIS